MTKYEVQKASEKLPSIISCLEQILLKMGEGTNDIIEEEGFTYDEMSSFIKQVNSMNLINAQNTCRVNIFMDKPYRKLYYDLFSTDKDFPENYVENFEESFKTLARRSVVILRMHYGIQEKRKTDDEIAEYLRITKTRVHQLYTRAMRQLRSQKQLITIGKPIETISLEEKEFKREIDRLNIYNRCVMVEEDLNRIYQEETNAGHLSLQHLKLNERTRNALSKKYNIVTIFNATDEEIFSLYGVGRMGLHHTITAVNSFLERYDLIRDDYLLYKGVKNRKLFQGRT